MKQTMKSCILEQPDTIRRVCQNAEKVCDSVYSIVGKGPFDKIYLIGSGTSLHTAIAAKYAFTKWFNAEVQVFTPFDFLYYYPHYRLDEKTLILGISQTARSIGTIHCLEKGREYGARTVMVTAEPDNPGGKSAEAILDTCTGEELVGAKTKGFTSTIAMLYLYAAGLAGKELDISLVPKWMEQSLRCTSEEIEDFAEEYKSAPSVTIIGGGTLTAAAKEGALLPYGGAGALHAVELARTLDIGTVVIPIEPGNFSAFGLLVAPIRYDEVCTYHKHEKDVSFDHMEEKFEKLEAEARKEMARDGVSESSVSFERKIDIRYFGQAYELTISVPNSPVNQLVWDKLVNDFSDAHERSYGFKKNDPMELVSLRLSVVGEMDKSNLYSKGEISKELPKPEEIRKAYFMGEWLDTAVYKRDALKAGNSFIGPAIIEETGATSVVGPGDKVTVDERMNLVVKIANHETGKMEALEEN